MEVPNPKFEEWSRTDELVKSWIFGTLSEEILRYVFGLNTAREILISLGENFNRNSVAREFELCHSLQMFSKKGKTFSAYCRNFKSLCDQLTSIGKSVDESMKIFTFLNGLGREYDPINTSLQSAMSRLPPSSFSDVVFEVTSFDNRLQSYEETADVSPHIAFQAQQTGFSASQKSYGQRGRGFGNYSRFDRARG